MRLVCWYNIFTLLIREARGQSEIDDICPKCREDFGIMSLLIFGKLINRQR